jgi:hypothetical protein
MLWLVLARRPNILAFGGFPKRKISGFAVHRFNNLSRLPAWLRMANNITLLNEKLIKGKILTIRGLQVMLDRDLAELYNIETRTLKQAVNRNKKRFPPDFMFSLNELEINRMVSQNVIPSKKQFGGAQPYAFTEQGIANLSSVLNSDKAIEVNIRIMRAFVSMRRFLASNVQLFYRVDRVEKKQLEHDRKFEQVFDAIQSRNITPEKGIFFEGQVFDSYKLVCDIIKSANKSILLIDNFVDESVLMLLSKRKDGVEAKIFTRDISKQLKQDVEKCNSQYPPIQVLQFSDSHDRFLIIDNKEVYHIGASLKDLGKKWFAFSRIDREALRMLEKLGTFGKPA